MKQSEASVRKSAEIDDELTRKSVRLDSYLSDLAERGGTSFQALAGRSTIMGKLMLQASEQLTTDENILDDTKKRILTLPTATMLEEKIANSIATYVEDNPPELPIDHSDFLNSAALELKQHVANILLPRIREELESGMSETIGTDVDKLIIEKLSDMDRHVVETLLPRIQKEV